MFYKYSFLFFICLLTSLNLKAQVESPDLLCVRNDSLFWDLPINPCGTFQHYEIFASDLPEGPFTKIDSVTDQNQLNYFFNNPGSLKKYFYLTSLTDCTGQTQLSSDTLDNRVPDRIPINFVTTEGGLVRIEWSLSNVPDVVAYVISRATQFGTVAIDTVDINFFIDSTASPTNNSEIYSVNAIDRCGNVSFFDEVHNTILLNITEDECEQELNLNWTAYNNWTNGVAFYLILSSEDGGITEMIVDTVNGSLTDYVFEAVKKDINYEIRVRAIEAVTGFESNSNIIQIQPSVVEAIFPFILYNADIQANGDVVLSWFWDGDIDVNAVNVSFVHCGDDVVVPLSVTVADPTANFQQTTISGLDINSCAYDFNIIALNPCGKIFTSNSLSTIFLQGEGFDNRADLNWNIVNTIAQSQNVLNVNDTSFSTPINVSLNQINYTDVWTEDNLEFCYQIEQTGEFIIAGFPNQDFVQHSNIICIARALNIFVPNAFAPGGINRTFHPYFSNTQIIDVYEFNVYDRWGGKLFSTDSPFVEWNGYSNGKLVNPGSYVFNLSLTTLGGEVIERKGDVLLLD